MNEENHSDALETDDNEEILKMECPLAQTPDNGSETQNVDYSTNSHQHTSDCAKVLSEQNSDMTTADGTSNQTSQPHTPSFIDVNRFADRATEISAKHVAQIAESNKLKLDELLNHQTILLESLEHENEKFSASVSLGQMETMMTKCRHYHTKLLKIRKSMNSITQRTSKIKKQCVKLQEIKARSLVEEEEARRKEIEREKLLVAQPVSLEPDIDANDAPSM